MDKKKFIKNLNYRKIALGLIAIAVISLVAWGLKDTHAFYSTSTELKVFSTTIGNFAGGGDTSTLEKNTDINVLYYVQDIFNTTKYNVVANAPANSKQYKLDEKRSNCIPKESSNSGDTVSYSDYSIDEATGEVKLTVTEDKIHQIVCRIYYSFEIETYETFNRDVNVVALVESTEGTIVTIKNGKAYSLQEIPTSGYKIGNVECTNKDEATKTKINYENGNLQVDYKVKDLCYVYFDKES